MMGPNICSIAVQDCNRIQIQQSEGLPTYLASNMNASDCGRSPAQPLICSRIGATANGWTSRGQ